MQRSGKAERPSGPFADARSASRASLFDSVRDMFSMKSVRGRRSNASLSLGASAGKKARPGETRTVVVAVLARMILTPLLLVPLMVWATSEDWHAVFEE